MEQLAECVLAELDAMACAKRKAGSSAPLNPAEKPKLKNPEVGESQGKSSSPRSLHASST